MKTVLAVTQSHYNRIVLKLLLADRTRPILTRGCLKRRSHLIGRRRNNDRLHQRRHHHPGKHRCERRCADQLYHMRLVHQKLACGCLCAIPPKKMVARFDQTSKKTHCMRVAGRSKTFSETYPSDLCDSRGSHSTDTAHP